jgi:iron complex transport system substrate-binding protein
LQGTCVEELFDDLRRVGEALGLKVEEPIRTLRERLERVRHAVKGLPKPRVAVVEWLEPPFLAGHWMPELLELAGGTALGVPPGDPSPRVTWERIRELQPEVLLYSFCGYALPQTLEELHGLGSPLHAEQMWALDSQYFCALTSKVVRGAEILASLLHPELNSHVEGKPLRAWIEPHLLEAQRVEGKA